MASKFGFVVLFIIHISFTSGKPPDAHIPNPNEVDAAIVFLDVHYNDALCLELLLVDCATHVTVGDEKICGSDGKTYENHCYFTHAMCGSLHSESSRLRLKNHGACVVTSTVAMTTVTHDVHTTTSEAANTVNPINAVVQNVFCQNVHSINCATSFDVVCGTDGQLYPNRYTLFLLNGSLSSQVRAFQGEMQEPDFDNRPGHHPLRSAREKVITDLRKLGLTHD